MDCRAVLLFRLSRVIRALSFVARDGAVLLSRQEMRLLRWQSRLLSLSARYEPMLRPIRRVA